MTSPIPQQKLLVSGWVDAVGGEISRGMPVLTEDGCRVGLVAAVVQNDPTQTVTHVLLGQVPPTAVYRLIPTDLLDRLEGEQLWLRAVARQIAALPVHHPDC
jgi:hypothetical protein